MSKELLGVTLARGKDPQKLGKQIKDLKFEFKRRKIFLRL